MSERVTDNLVQLAPQSIPTKLYRYWLAQRYVLLSLIGDAERFDLTDEEIEATRNSTVDYDE